jgi:hypothetical protein
MLESQVLVSDGRLQEAYDVVCKDSEETYRYVTCKTVGALPNNADALKCLVGTNFGVVMLALTFWPLQSSAPILVAIAPKIGTYRARGTQD